VAPAGVAAPLVAASAPRGWRRHLPLLVGLVFSLLFGWLAARGVDWSRAGHALGRVSWGWVLAYTVALMGIQGLRMLRWSLQVHALGETSWRRSLSIGAVGLSAIFFLPARLGEAVRPLLIADSGRVRLGEGIATAVVERLIDGLVVGLMLVGVGLWVSDSVARAVTIERAGLVVGGIFLALTFGVLFAVRFIDVFCRVVDALVGRRWPRLAERLQRLILNFRQGLVILARTHHVPSYLGLTGLLWLLNGASIVLLFEAIGFDLSIEAAFVVLSATAVGILVPAAPTSLGTIHFAAMWALGLYAVADSAAFDFAVLYHLSQVAANLLVGVLGILAGGLSLRRLRGVVAPSEVAARLGGTPLQPRESADEGR
jgi:glycosyltransferase 2 family protein